MGGAERGTMGRGEGAVRGHRRKSMLGLILVHLHLAVSICEVTWSQRRRGL